MAGCEGEGRESGKGFIISSPPLNNRSNFQSYHFPAAPSCIMAGRRRRSQAAAETSPQRGSPRAANAAAKERQVATVA